MLTDPITSSASGAIFGPMLRTFTWFYDTCRSNSRANVEERRRVYEKRFEPAYEKLSKVHTNYLTSFHQFYEICRKFETPSQDLLSQFKHYGVEYTTWREDLRNFTRVTTELSKSFRRPKEREAILGFRDAIVAYFDVSIADGRYRHWPSWFTAFINDFEDHVREGRSPWEADYKSMGVKDPTGTFIQRLKSAYETELPNRWSAISAAKTRLEIVFAT